MRYYNQQIVMRGDNLDAFVALVNDRGNIHGNDIDSQADDGPAIRMLVYDPKRFPKELQSNDVGVARRYYLMFKDLDIEKRYMIPSAILR